MFTAFLVRRVLSAAVVVIGVSVLTYALVSVTAGNYVPGQTEGMRARDVEQLRRNLGLDQPFHIQYLTWLLRVLHGDFGNSAIDGSVILSQIAARLPNTLALAASAFLLGFAVAIPVGILGAVRHGETADNLLTVFAVAGYAAPQFWVGLVLILVFSVGFRSWGLPSLPSSGAYDPVSGGGLLDRLIHLVMPATVLSLPYIASWSRYIRSSILGVLSQEYVRTARAKGLPERRVLYVHALRNAMLPLVTLAGLEFPRLVSGSLIIEVVFGWPGVGRFAYQSALTFDYTAVMGVTTLVSVMVVTGNLIADVIYAVIDPRIRLA
jgi:peptide/nickel transport system permease protein